MGGGSIRMERIAAELRLLGHRVTITDRLTPSLRGVDVAHIWQDQHPDAWKQGRNARKHGTPYVVSPFGFEWDTYGFWNLAHPVWRISASLLGPTISRRLFSTRTHRRVTGLSSWQQTHELLDEAAALLPTSQRERKFLARHYRISDTNIHVAHNAVDTKRFSRGSVARFRRTYGIEPGFILCAARIHDTKNQLGLAKALRGSGHRLVLAGGLSPAGREYLRQCQAEAERSGVSLAYLGSLSQAELADAFAAAKVHVLPSWAETTGQVSLQAAIAGCAVVHTAESPWREYFGDRAEICRPESPRSIRRAIDRAEQMTARRKRALAKRVKRFTWERAARETLAAYNKALKETK